MLAFSDAVEIVGVEFESPLEFNDASLVLNVKNCTVSLLRDSSLSRGRRPSVTASTACRQ